MGVYLLSLSVRRLLRHIYNNISIFIYFTIYFIGAIIARKRATKEPNYSNSPNSDHLLAPVIFTSLNWPRAAGSPTTRTRRLPGVRPVRS